MVVAKKTMPGDDLKALIAWLRANPGKASAGTQGAGGSSQIGGIFFQNTTATRFQFIPYRCGAPAIQDLVAGQIDLMIAAAGDASAQVRAGTVKAYAVMANRRLAVVPDVPTVDEAGLVGAYYSGWFGIWAPARTPKDIVAKLNAAVREALGDPGVGSRAPLEGPKLTPRGIFVRQPPCPVGMLPGNLKNPRNLHDHDFQDGPAAVFLAGPRRPQEGRLCGFRTVPALLAALAAAGLRIAPGREHLATDGARNRWGAARIIETPG
jgi:Tripartite tricarboxylate transporter family receptor